MNRETDTRPTQRSIARRPGWRQWAGPAAALIVLVVLGRIAGARWPEIEASLAGAGPSGWALFVGAAALLAVCCFPVAGLSLSAGALYGPWPGLPLVALASLLGALVMFAGGRGLLRGRILAFIAHRPRLAAVDRLVGQRAVRLNLLTRLSPLNFGMASYTLAAGRSGLGAYVVGTAGAVPGMAVYVWLGWLARDVGSGRSPGMAGGAVLLAVGALAFGVLTWLMTRLVRQAWREAEAEATGGDTGDRP